MNRSRNLLVGWPPLVAMLIAVAGTPGRAEAQTDAASLARRIAAIAAIAADEYALGVVEGRIVAAPELEEARLFLDEAADLARDLPPVAQPEALRTLATLRDDVAALRDGSVVRAGVAKLRETLAAAVGVPLDPLPRDPPSIAWGEKLYEANCTTCHGSAGRGDGPRAAELEPPPADLTDREALAGSSPLDFYRKITFGIAGTDMASFEDGLTLEERWAVALYASTLRFGGVERTVGASWFRDHCDTCRLWISDLSVTAGMTDDSLAAWVAGQAGEAAPPQALAYARAAGAREVLGGDRTLAARRMARHVTEGIDHAVRLGLAGNTSDAQRRLMEAYLEFERVESTVGARSARAARETEQAFAELRTALASGDVARIAAARSGADAAIERSAEVLAAGSSPVLMFGQSLLIMLREGLEAMLIVAALAAIVVQAGARHRMREIAVGIIAALVASVLTAGAFVTVWRVTAAHREALEGATMLLASIVLFAVASWLVSKVESEKWKRFVHRQAQHAIARGGAFALAGLVFLTVYREGFETVLFYGALFGTAEDALGGAGIVAGMVAGVLLLGAAYVAIRRYGMRVPLRPFFAITGILLTVMSVSFAGQGVAELQAAGWIPSTPINLPALPALGVFPTLQTMLAQVGMAVAFSVALGWIFLFSPRLSAAKLPQR